MNVSPEPFYLPREGREPARWQLTTDAGTITSVEVRLTPSSAWVAADWADGVATLLVRGPAFTSGDGVLSQPVTANCTPELRAVVGASMVIRRGGPIFLRG